MKKGRNCRSRETFFLVGKQFWETVPVAPVTAPVGQECRQGRRGTAPLQRPDRGSQKLRPRTVPPSPASVCSQAASVFAVPGSHENAVSAGISASYRESRMIPVDSTREILSCRQETGHRFCERLFLDMPVQEGAPVPPSPLRSF